MAYTKSTKEAILDNLATAISGISGIGFVDYQRVYNSSITQDKYPGVFINDIRTDKVRLLKDIVKNLFSVELVCWVWASDTQDLGTEMNSFMEKVKSAVLNDITRGGNAFNTKLTIVETDAGSRHPQGLFVCAVEITFFSSN